MNRLVLLTLIVALSGCAGLRKYVTPEAPSGTEKVNLSAANAERFGAQNPVVAWWREFDDPQLGDLVEQALKANLDVRSAYAVLSEARANARASGYDRFPTVTASGGYTRERRSERAANQNFNTDVYSNIYDAGFDASWELDIFGRVSESIRAQKALSQAAEAEFDGVSLSIAAEVARTYIALRGAQYRLNIAERNAKNQAETLELTQKLTEGGRSSALDSARAQTQLDLTRAQIPALQAEIKAAIYTLSVLAGQVPDALEGNLNSIKPLPSLPPKVNVGNAGDLLRRRPDVRAAERELAARTAQYNVNVTQLLPTADIVGSLGFLATRISDFGSSALTGSLGPVLRWRALDIGRALAEVDAADARAKAALAMYEKTVLGALGETQTTLSNFAREEDRRAILQSAARSAQTATSLARMRYEQGTDGLLDLLSAERTQLEAEDTLALSEIRSAQALVAVYKALGGGWIVGGQEAKAGRF